MKLECGARALATICKLGIALGSVAVSMGALAAQATLQTPFVAALGGVWDGPGNPVVPEVLVSGATGPLLAEAGALPAAYGKFRSDYGANGFEATVMGGIDREVDGGTLWSDGLIVSGGTGTGSLSLSAHVVGTVSGEVEMFYALFVSSQPFDLQVILNTVGAAPGFWAVQLPNATRLMFTGVANRCGQTHASNECGHVPFQNFQGPLDLTLTASATFTYGQPLYVASVFGGGVSIFGGSAAFFNSAHFGVSAPAGDTLAALSGSTYASAVPEPAAAPLFGAGLLLCAGLAWRRTPRR